LSPGSALPGPLGTVPHKMDLWVDRWTETGSDRAPERPTALRNAAARRGRPDGGTEGPDCSPHRGAPPVPPPPWRRTRSGTSAARPTLLPAPRSAPRGGGKRREPRLVPTESRPHIRRGTSGSLAPGSLAPLVWERDPLPILPEGIDEPPLRCLPTAPNPPTHLFSPTSPSYEFFFWSSDYLG